MQWFWWKMPKTIILGKISFKNDANTNRKNYYVLTRGCVRVFWNFAKTETRCFLCCCESVFLFWQQRPVIFKNVKRFSNFGRKSSGKTKNKINIFVFWKKLVRFLSLKKPKFPKYLSISKYVFSKNSLSKMVLKRIQKSPEKA